MLRLLSALYVLNHCRFCIFRVTERIGVCKCSFLGGVVRLCFIHKGRVSLYEYLLDMEPLKYDNVRNKTLIVHL
jgi:hypothetical protein